MISFENFGFKYDGANSFGVYDIDFTVKKGELAVLTGPSGCGKTTLTRCINGLVPDYYDGSIRGKCIVNGMDISEHETGDLSAFVGSVFQDPRSQFFTLNVKNEIPFPAENLGITQDKLRENMRRTVEELELAPLIGKSIFALSSGEKQKIAAASVYCAGVDIYVLDEPSANLDTAGTEQLKCLLEKLKEQGKTIVVSEHKLYYLRDIADKFICMKNGTIGRMIGKEELAQLSPKELSEMGLRQLRLESIECSVPQTGSFSEDITLEARDISFHYKGGEPLWKDVSFSCKGGEVIGITGKNGAGKSTLIRVLMGLEKPSAGRIFINGKPADKKHRRSRSFYVMQDVDYQLIAGSVREEMLMGHENEDGINERINDLLSEFSLSDYAELHPSELSGGQKQRLSIALACLSGKKILFFDEPTSGLDAENMRLVRTTIIEMARKGCICFVITHDYEFAANCFTSLLKIEGETIRHYAPNEYSPKLISELSK